MIINMGAIKTDDGWDFSDEPAIIVGKVPAKKPATVAIAKVAAPQPPKIFGLPQKTFYIALATLLAAGGYYLVAGRRVANPRRGRERRVSNPRGGSTRIEKAKKFREDFHWGLPTNAVVTRKVHKQPKVAVKLGELHAVTYRTKKHGEKVQLFEHHFEGKKPWLAMDIDNKRLHLLGGSYTVGADGIAG